MLFIFNSSCQVKLSIKNIIWALKLPNVMHLCQRISQSSKQLLKCVFHIGLQLSLRFSSIESKRYTWSGLLSLLSSRKSHGAKSCDYGGCGTIWVEFSAKWSRRINALWHGALLWCKNQELACHISDFFKGITSLKRCITLKKYSLSTVWPGGTN